MPLRCEGIGLGHGEGMECLWSFLRHFGRMTKEMRPTHRINVLSHALVYYGIQSEEVLCQWVAEEKSMDCVSKSAFSKFVC